MRNKYKLGKVITRNRKEIHGFLKRYEINITQGKKLIDFNRYNISVTAPDGCYVVWDFKEFENINLALDYAVRGAGLIK